MKRNFPFILFFLLSLIMCSCSDKPIEVKWQRSFTHLGSSSSPSCIDLNDDGVLDCVIGAGLNEFDHTDSSVVAINGADGEVLWAINGTDQVVGSPVFLNINEDDIPDVIIGGRGAQLFAIDGLSGELIWRYQIKHNDHDALGYIRFNFYTPQVLPDVNEDNVKDILVSNGGNFSADPVSGNDRYPGVLAVLSGKDGKIISAATMPDRAETYMSPVLIPDENPDSIKIIYGSGGETFGGHLYEVSLAELMNNDLSNSVVILSKEGHGFIAPPTLTDITGDGKLDIVVNWHGGEMIAVDRKNYEMLWKYKIEDTEIYASPTPGYANEDDVPDFFTQFTEGKWPNYTFGHQRVINGQSGEVLQENQLGCGSFSTALSHDLNNDGYSEFIFAVNDFNCDKFYQGNTRYSLMKLDLRNNVLSDIISPISAKNIFSTPWLGDLDQDGKLDIIVSVQSNYNDELSYYGFHMYRLAINDASVLTKRKSWNEYLGSERNSTFL